MNGRRVVIKKVTVFLKDFFNVLVQVSLWTGVGPTIVKSILHQRLRRINSFELMRCSNFPVVVFE